MFRCDIRIPEGSSKGRSIECLLHKELMLTEMVDDWTPCTWSTTT